MSTMLRSPIDSLAAWTLTRRMEELATSERNLSNEDLLNLISDVIEAYPANYRMQVMAGVYGTTKEPDAPIMTQLIELGAKFNLYMESVDSSYAIRVSANSSNKDIVWRLIKK